MSPGERLAWARENAGMTIEQAAETTGFGIRALEEGTPASGHAYQVLSVLYCCYEPWLRYAKARDIDAATTRMLAQLSDNDLTIVRAFCERIGDKP